MPIRTLREGLHCEEVCCEAGAFMQVKDIRSTRSSTVDPAVVPQPHDDSLTLVMPDDLLHVLRELRYISVKEFHSPMKPSPLLVESHPFMGLLGEQNGRRRQKHDPGTCKLMQTETRCPVGTRQMRKSRKAPEPRVLASSLQK